MRAIERNSPWRKKLFRGVLLSRIPITGEPFLTILKPDLILASLCLALFKFLFLAVLFERTFTDSLELSFITFEILEWCIFASLFILRNLLFLLDARFDFSKLRYRVFLDCLALLTVVMSLSSLVLFLMLLSK